MKIFRRLDYWMHRRERDAELAEEMAFHREMSGEPIGNATIAREDARAVWIWPWLESVFQDLRYAIRNLLKQPGFALVALLTLGAAIGLNTSFFSVFDAIVLRLWPVRNPSELVKILAQEERSRPHGLPVAEYRHLADHAKTFSSIFAAFESPVHLGFEGFGRNSWGMFVSGNYFQTLGVRMELGRGFLPDEDRLDDPQHVVVLSYPVWRDRFGSDRGIAGTQLRIDDIPFTVVGVVSEDFTGTAGGREDLWIPIAAFTSLRPNDPSTRAFINVPDNCCASFGGRLGPGVKRAQAAAELDVLHRQFESMNKLDASRIVLADPSMMAGHPKRKTFLPVFGLMFAALILVLLLACANVSNLLIARAAARQREIEIRRALGAGRSRIVRQLLTEGFVLALAASAIGIAIASKLPQFLLRMAADDAPYMRLTPDAKLIAYAALLAAVTCIAFALAPALQGTRTTHAAARLRLRNVLLTSQVAMSVVLLIGAGLMLTGVEHARRHDPGFRISDVSVLSMELPASSYDPKRVRELNAELARHLSEVRAGMTVREPLGNAHWAMRFRLPGEAKDVSHDLEFHEISPEYFDVLGIPIVAGRNLAATDEGRHNIVVNQAMARRYFNGENAAGKSIIVGENVMQIVGVSRDAYVSYLESVSPLMFELPTGRQVPRVLVRSGDAGSIETVTSIVRQLEPRARVQAIPLADNLTQRLSGSRVMAGIAGMLGAFALVLAIVGISGVFAYVVEQRTKEIGIRMALGADAKQVLSLVLSGTARAVAIGLMAGFVVAGAAARLLSEYLYGVSPYDPRAYLAVGVVLAIAGLIAAFLPARRATRVDPLAALRVE
jgi:predicted permease